MLDALRRIAKRTDTRASILIATLLLTGIAIESALLYAFVAMESLESADAWVQHILRTVEREVAAGVDPGLAVSDVRVALDGAEIAARVEPPGGPIASWGRWPDSSATSPALSGDDTRDLLAYRVLDPTAYLLGSGVLDDGSRLEVAVSMAHFAEELHEIRHGLLLLASIASALALVGAIVATSWAFRPLRRASRVLEQIGPRHLGERMPDRGTRDPVDEHSRLLNSTLGEIEESFARLREFSSDLAHEFRTPLNRVATVSEVAKDGTSEQMIDALDSVRTTAGDLGRVVDALLLIAEVEEGRASTAFRRVDVAKRLEHAIALFEPAFSEHGSAIHVEISPATILGVPHLIDRVIVNLLENALQHTDPGTEVRICCRSTHGTVEISVEDDGGGIPENLVKSVFERFVTAREGRRSGHGLGLAIARSIARHHGGDLRLETSGMGGAKFVVSFPGVP